MPARDLRAAAEADPSRDLATQEEVGAAIHLGPNASKIALKWGLSLEKLNSPEVNFVRLDLLCPPPSGSRSCSAPWLK
mgnify:CR=1 FL=1